MISSCWWKDALINAGPSTTPTPQYCLQTESGHKALALDVENNAALFNQKILTHASSLSANISNMLGPLITSGQREWHWSVSYKTCFIVLLFVQPTPMSLSSKLGEESKPGGAALTTADASSHIEDNALPAQANHIVYYNPYMVRIVFPPCWKHLKDQELEGHRRTTRSTHSQLPGGTFNGQNDNNSDMGRFHSGESANPSFFITWLISGWFVCIDPDKAYGGIFTAEEIVYLKYVFSEMDVNGWLWQTPHNGKMSSLWRI